VSRPDFLRDGLKGNPVSRTAPNTMFGVPLTTGSDKGVADVREAELTGRISRVRECEVVRLKSGAAPQL